MGEKKKFLLRVDEEVFQSYERWAQDEFRSTNAQMEFVLRDALIRAARYKNSAKLGLNCDPANTSASSEKAKTESKGAEKKERR